MKYLFLALAIYLLVTQAANASNIEVNVVENVKGKTVSFTYDNVLNLYNFSLEFYNTGSIPYRARARLEIFEDNQTIFTGWSKEKDMLTGSHNSFNIYWFSNKTGKYDVKFRMYFGNEFLDYEKFSFAINNSSAPRDVFEIREFRTYDNFIVLDVKSEEDVNNVIIIPSKYKTGWIFEQKEINSIRKDSAKIIVLPYYPTLWQPSSLTLIIASKDGKYYTEKTIEIEKKKGLESLFYYILDNVKIAFSS